MQKNIETDKQIAVYTTITAIFLLSYLTFGKDITLGVTSTSCFYTHLTYIFVHANLFHLITNIFSLSFTLILLKKIANMKYYVMTAIGLISAFVASFIFMQDIPTVGASGVVYALLGTYCYLRFDKLALKLLLTLTIINLLQYFFGTINVFIHAFSFAFGFIGTALWDSYYVIKFVRNEKR